MRAGALGSPPRPGGEGELVPSRPGPAQPREGGRSGPDALRRRLLRGRRDARGPPPPRPEAPGGIPRDVDRIVRDPRPRPPLEAPPSPGGSPARLRRPVRGGGGAPRGPGDDT